MRLPEPTTRAGEAGLAALLADPARAVVGVDYDGTLAPIVPRPEDAVPAAGAVDALGRLARLVGAVVVVTGRPVTGVLQLARLDEVPDLGRLVVLGHYGLERWEATTRRISAPELPPGVDLVRRELPDLLRSVGAPPGTSVEDKHSALAVHVRNAAAPADAMELLRGPLTELARRAGLELTPGRLVLELRPRGTDKGGALRGFVAERQAGSVLFAGDDLGDLPAYETVDALRREGVPGLKVCSASEEAPQVREQADLAVDGPAGVVTFFTALAAAIGSG